MQYRMTLILFALIAFPLPVSVIEQPTPIISDLTVSPTSGPAGSIYRISLRITGSGGIIPLLHQMREGREAIDVVLRDDGKEGDIEKGDGIYTGHSDVPPTAAKQTHRFEVYIRDRSGRKSNLLEYRFTVVAGALIEDLKRGAEPPYAGSKSSTSVRNSSSWN